MAKENEPEDVELASYDELKRIGGALERIATVLENCTYEDGQGFQTFRVTVDSLAGAVLKEAT